MRVTRALALCAHGCGRRVKESRARYCSHACAEAERRLPRPLCLCGCGREVKGPRHKYAAPGCVPRSQRAANCRAGRATFAYRHRMRRFHRVLQLLQGRSLKTWELLAVLDQVYDMGRAAARAARHRARRGAVQETGVAACA